MRYSAMAPSRSPFSASALPRLLCGWACVRLEAKRGAVFGDGPVQISLVAEREAEVVVRGGVVRLEAKRGAVFGDGPVQISLVTERGAEVVVRVGLRPVGGEARCGIRRWPRPDHPWP